MLKIKEKFIKKIFFSNIMNIYEIKEKLSRYKQVFNINEISRITGIKKNVLSVYLERMEKKGLITRIEKGKYALTKNPFIIASHLVFPSYLSLTTAFYLHGTLSQVPTKLFVITTKKKQKLRVGNVEIIFISTRPKYMFGYRKQRFHGGYVFLADLEKAIVDSLLYLRYVRLSYIIDAIKTSSIDKLIEYAKRIDSEAVIRRMGYLLDKLGVKHSLKRKNKVVYKLNPSIKKKGKFNKKWYLYINEEIK